MSTDSNNSSDYEQQQQEEEEEEEQDDDNEVHQDNNNHSNNDNEFLSPFDLLKEKMTFRFDPNELPRPLKPNETFQSRSGSNCYSTNINEWIYHPLINTSYTVQETENSSINLIRPSFHVISQSKAFYNKTKLKYGFCIEPFQDDLNIQSIPINSTDQIVSCIKCSSYYTKQNISKQYPTGPSEEALKYTCDICGYENMFTSHSHYFPKFNQVSIDYAIALDDDITVKECELYAIDISSNAIQRNFSLYVIEMIRNSLKSLIDFNRKIAFMTFDEYQLCFYYYDHNNIRMIYVNDLKNPFIPLPTDILFDNKERYENILEVIIGNIDKKRQCCIKLINSKSNVSSIDSVIKATIDYELLNSNPPYEFYHIILFTNNKSINDINNSKPLNYIPNNPFIIPTNNKQFNNKISYDLFIVSYDENNSLALHNYTNTNHNIKSHYYMIDSNNQSDYIQYDKMYYDLYHIMDSDRYYDLSFNIITSKFFKSNIISPCYNNNQKLNCANTDLMLSYEIIHNINQLPNDKSTYCFQWYLNYISPKDNCIHLRIFSYKSQTTDNICSLFSSVDLDSLLPLTIHYEVRELITSKKSLQDSLMLMNKNIEDILINSLHEYKSEVFMGSTIDSLSIPLTLINFPLYLYSFTHLKALRLSTMFKFPLCFNAVYHSLVSVMHSPLRKIKKIVYPQLLRIDSDKMTQMPLSLFFITMNMALLYDDGDFVTLFIMNRIKDDLFKEISQGCDKSASNEIIKEAIIAQIDKYNQQIPDENTNCNSISHRLITELIKYNSRVFNVKVITDDEQSILNAFLILLKEDSAFIGEKSYEDFIYFINQKICEKYLSSFS